MIEKQGHQLLKLEGTVKLGYFIVPANKLTDSMTSKKTSFLRYFTPSVRHDTAFVTAGGGLGATSNL